MEWILFIITFSVQTHAQIVTTQTFRDRPACEQAVKELASRHIDAYCMPNETFPHKK